MLNVLATNALLLVLIRHVGASLRSKLAGATTHPPEASEDGRRAYSHAHARLTAAPSGILRGDVLWIEPSTAPPHGGQLASSSSNGTSGAAPSPNPIASATSGAARRPRISTFTTSPWLTLTRSTWTTSTRCAVRITRRGTACSGADDGR